MFSIFSPNIYAQSSLGVQRQLSKEKEFLICTEGNLPEYGSKVVEAKSHMFDLHDIMIPEVPLIEPSDSRQDMQYKLAFLKNNGVFEIEAIQMKNVEPENLSTTKSASPADRKIIIVESRQIPKSSTDSEPQIVVTWISEDENEFAVLIEDDLVLDQTRDDGTSMFIDGNVAKGTNTINFVVVLNQTGYTIVEVVDPLKGTVLDRLFEGANVAEHKYFEYDYSHLKTDQVLIEVRHSSKTGESLKSHLILDLDRADEVPTNIFPSAGVEFTAKLSPTLGKGEFRIQADFNAAATVKVLIHDLTGKLVETLHAGPVSQGNTTFTGDSSNWTPGTYIASIQDGRGVWTQKMIVR